MSPAVRVLRTIIQVLVAEAAAVPAVVATLGYDAATTAKIGAVCGAVVVLVSTAQNVVEHASGRTLGAVLTPNPPVPLPPAPAAGPVDIPALRQGG